MSVSPTNCDSTHAHIHAHTRHVHMLTMSCRVQHTEASINVSVVNHQKVRRELNLSHKLVYY